MIENIKEIFSTHKRKIFIIFFVLILVFLANLIPKKGNVKIDGTVKSLTLNSFYGDVGVSSDRISMNNGAWFKNNHPLMIELDNGKKETLDPGELKIIYKDKKGEDKDIAFASGTKFLFDFNKWKNDERFDKINYKSVNLKRKLKLRQDNLLPIYELELKGEKIGFNASTFISDSMHLMLPKKTIVKIDKGCREKKFSPSSIKLFPVPDMKEGMISFRGEFNELKIMNSLGETYLNDKMVINGETASFKLTSDFDTKIKFIQIGSIREFETPMTEIIGKSKGDELGIKVIAKYISTKDSNIQISGELTSLTFDGRRIIVKNFLQWLHKKYDTIIIVVITAIVTTVISSLFSFFSNSSN